MLLNLAEAAILLMEVLPADMQGGEVFIRPNMGWCMLFVWVSRPDYLLDGIYSYCLDHDLHAVADIPLAQDPIARWNATRKHEYTQSLQEN